MFMNHFLSNRVSGKSGANRKRPVSDSQGIDLDILLDFNISCDTESRFWMVDKTAFVF